MAKYFLLFLFAVFGALSDATDWCNVSCYSGATHTMCQHPYAMTSPSCNTVISEGLTQSQKNTIVDFHNQVRREAAANMSPLVWDDDLATVAQRWANQCNVEHDGCRNLQTGQGVGQNVAISYGGPYILEDDVQKLMQGWANEKIHVSQDIITSFRFHHDPTKIIAHYTQMVWRTTTKIGCGYIHFQGPTTVMSRIYVPADKNLIYLVCNYGVGGNFAGARVY